MDNRFLNTYILKHYFKIASMFPSTFLRIGPTRFSKCCYIYENTKKAEDQKRIDNSNKTPSTRTHHNGSITIIARV